MLGNAATQGFFASAHFIQMNSNVWAEWNYNQIAQPFVTATSSARPTYWGPDPYGTASNNWQPYAWKAGNATTQFNYQSVQRTSINSARTPSATHAFWSGSADGRNITTQISILSNSSDTVSTSVRYTAGTVSGFYKLVFFAKGSTPFIYGYTDPVPGLKISSFTSGTSSSTYIVQSIGSNGQVLNIKTAPQVTAAGIDGTKSVAFTWTATPGKEIGYNIYKLIPNTTYLTSSANNYPTYGRIASKAIDASKTASYVETYTDATASSTSVLDTGFAVTDERISVSPQIYLLNNNSYIQNNFYVKTVDVNGGNILFDQKTLKLDGITWQKVELYINALNNSFDSMVLNLGVYSQLNDLSFNITPIWIYQITEFDYFNNKYFPLDSVFSGRRPGEAILNPFMSDVSTSGISYYTDLTDAQKKAGAPTRSLTYSFFNPNNIIDVANNTQLIPSIYDRYQYYISDSGNAAGLSAYYDQYLSVNKIYVKIANQISNVLNTNNSSSLTLYFNTSKGTASSLTVNGPFYFDNNGISVFYYASSRWFNSSGSAFVSSVRSAASAGTTSGGGWLPPNIGSNGQISTAQMFNNLTGISLLLPYTSSYSSNSSDDSRIHIVEISPRLEIDLTDYVESYSFDKELDRGDTSANFPIGYITSNNGSVKINNFPVYYNNKPFTIFENKSPQSTFYDLLRQGVKFTGYFWSPAARGNFTETIPAFSLYADTFNIDDINSVNVNLYDSTKHYMMANESPQYVAKGESLYTIINHLMALSGFSDYSRTELQKVTQNKNNTTYFWTDESKTTLDCLQELLVANQIGAFIDETGFFRFIDIDTIIAKKYTSASTIDFTVSDDTHTYWQNYPNIVQDSYREAIDPRIGKILINYVLPNTLLSPKPTEKRDSLPSETITRKKVFSEESSFGLANQRLDIHSQIPKASYFGISSKDHDFYADFKFNEPRNSLGAYSTGFFIGGEAVYAGGAEYSFIVSGSPGYTFTKFIKTESDIQDAVQDAVGNLGGTRQDISYQPTKRIMDVSRGMYGTNIKDHYIYVSADDANFQNDFTSFYITNTSGLTATYSINNALSTSNAMGLIKVGSGNGEVTLSSPANDNSIVTFGPSTKLQSFDHMTMHLVIPQAKTNKYGPCVGFFYNYSGNKNDFSNAIFFERKGTSNFTNVHLGLINNLGTLKNNITKATIYDADDTTKTRSITLPVNLFDGQEHRISMWIQPYIKGGYTLSIRTDDSRVYKYNISLSYPTLSSTNLVVIPSHIGADNFYGGVFVCGSDVNGVKSDQITATFREIYFANWPKKKTYSSDVTNKNIFDLDLNPKYHFLTRTFLSEMMNATQEPYYYLWQSIPRVIGFKHYKNEHVQPAPIFPTNVELSFFGYNPVPSAFDIASGGYLLVTPDNLAMSYPKTSPFLVSMVIANNTSPLNQYRTAIVVKADNDQIATDSDYITITPFEMEAEVLNFTADKKYEKVINTNHLNNSIQMQTSWIQSERDAANMVKKIAALLPTFNSTVDVDIFGNPLIETGDIAGLYYKLKGIGFDANGNSSSATQRYFVSSVKQNWDGSLQTSLVLRPL